jgi:hypothetical protein
MPDAIEITRRVYAAKREKLKVRAFTLKGSLTGSEIDSIGLGTTGLR